MIEEIQNLEVPGPYGPIPLRLYRPRTRLHANFPALVFFHGGGWVLGSIDTHDAHCRFLANQADVAALSSVGYRCAPEHQLCLAVAEVMPMPARRGLQIVAHQLGIDSERIGVAGDSAGGKPRGGGQPYGPRPWTPSSPVPAFALPGSQPLFRDGILQSGRSPCITNQSGHAMVLGPLPSASLLGCPPPAHHPSLLRPLHSFRQQSSSSPSLTHSGTKPNTTPYG